jgi:hypothetical protein
VTVKQAAECPRCADARAKMFRLIQELHYMRQRLGMGSEHEFKCALHQALRMPAVARLLHENSYDADKALAACAEYGAEFDTSRLRLVRVKYGDAAIESHDDVARPYLKGEVERWLTEAERLEPCSACGGLGAENRRP